MRFLGSLRDDNDPSSYTASDYFREAILTQGNSPAVLSSLLAQAGGTSQPATQDVLNSEATQILAAEQLKAFRWDADAIQNPSMPNRPPNAASKYAKFSFSLKPFIGRKVTIRFASSETLKGHATSFLVDNVAIAVS
jgi:hypothetical protein